MARDPNTSDLAADYDSMVVQMTAMREDLAKLATQVGAVAAARGSALAETVNGTLQDARAYAGRKSQDADARIGEAVSSNPYLALGIAAGIGLLLGAVSRR